MPSIALPRLSWRVASAIAALLLVLATCGSTIDVTASTTSAPGTEEADDRSDEPDAIGVYSLDDMAPSEERGQVVEPTGDAPEQGATTTQAGPAPDSFADEVELREPHLVVRADRLLLREDADVDGVEHIAQIGEFTVQAEDLREGGLADLDALAADARTFRPLTPDVTAQSPEVWQRLDEGDVLVRHDVAHELGLELGERIELHAGDVSTTVRIGALAANGAPPFADVIVPFEVAAALGAPGVSGLVVSASHDPEGIAEELADVGDVEVRQPPEPERVRPRPTQGSFDLEPFTYTSRGDGTIAIHGDWVQRNIVTIEIPRMGSTRCHRAMVPQLFAALEEIIEEGLYDHFEPHQFGGCWVPRHIMWDPSRGISMHAWGLAIDFNVQDNWYGDPPQMDRRIVEIFERWGFEWGGHWSTPDGMHFELDRLVQVD